MVRRVRYARIRGLAEAILSRHVVLAPPVPIKEMILREGIDLHHGKLDGVSGLLARKGTGRALIGINRDHARTRQRFTMAHEYGHYLLHEGLTSHTDERFRVNYRDRTSAEATDVEEMEANFFAACLLMPEALLDGADAMSAVDDDDLLKALAKRFDVSRHAMSLRLANVYGLYKPF